MQGMAAGALREIAGSKKIIVSIMINKIFPVFDKYIRKFYESFTCEAVKAAKALLAIPAALYSLKDKNN